MGVKLVYITDKNYAMPTLVSIVSAIQNKSSNYKIYVITTFEDAEIIDKFRLLNNGTTEISIIPVNIKEFIPQSISSVNHVTKTALIKFFLPDILSNEDKILYIDGDTIIQKPLDELYNMALGNNYAGVVFDNALFIMPQHAARLQIPVEKYFNSGVMLLDLKKMRTDNLSGALLEYRTTQYNYFMDQDAFNKILYGSVLFIPDKYNMVPVSHYHSKNKIKEAVILHFAARFKPWIYNLGESSALFKKYSKLSPYKDTKLKLKNNNFVIKFLNALIKQNL